MLKKWLLTVACALCAASLFAPAVLAAKPIELKFALTTGEGHVYNVTAEYFKKRLEELTKGRMIVHIYPSGQLSGSQRVLAEGLQLGTLDMTVPSVAAVSGFEKRVQVASLPYIFKDAAHAYAVMDGHIGDTLGKSMEKFNMLVLGWWPTGSYAITNSKRPINTVEDLKGLKFRVMENPVHVALYKAWGAIPTPMAYGEVFTALQQGTVDGQENSDANIYANKYHEVQKYLAITRHFFLPSPMLMSKSRYESLPKDLQPLFMQAAKDAVAESRAEYARQAEAAIENMKKAGMEVTYPDTTEFKKIALTIYPEFLKQLGPDVQAWVKEIQETSK